MTYCIGEAMSTKPVSVHPDDTLVKVAMIMRENDVGSVLVKNNGDLCGIVTEWDFVHKVAAKELNVAETYVRDIMAKDLLTISPRMDVFDAIRLMKDADVRHLPVIESGKLVGYITMKDILRIQPELFEILSEKFDMQL